MWRMVKFNKPKGVCDLTYLCAHINILSLLHFVYIASVLSMSFSSLIGFVTGGASGLGRSAVVNLLRNGARVVVADLPHQEDTAESLKEEFGDSVLFQPVDVTSENMVEDALDNCIEIFGGVPSVVVNCAGRADASKTVGRKGLIEEKNQSIY